MSDRTDRIAAFLDRAGWGAATRSPLAGDASNRRYERLRTSTDGAATAVLMDAPAERSEDVRPFIAMTRHLRALGLSAPRLLAEDAAEGLLLLEDLGDALFARLLASEPELEVPLYRAASDVLVHLQRSPPPGRLACLGPEAMGDLAALAAEWYLPGLGGEPVHHSGRAELAGTVAQLCDRHAAGAEVTVLRDYHAENLIWLPDRTDPGRVGLLDYQDAVAGHPAYDLVSLLQDARRAVSPQCAAQTLHHYLDRTGRDAAPFEAAFASLGAQRNLRIIGVFARLCLRDGKPRYLEFIPRVWRNLQQCLTHPALGDLAALVELTMPEPTEHRLERLRAQCPTPRNP